MVDRVAGCGRGCVSRRLDADVYRAITTPSLRDVDVVDAKGNSVAADVFGPDAPLASPPRFVRVPWFVVRTPRVAKTMAALR